MPWYHDLELRRHGAIYLEPELNVALILPDGRSLEWWTDLDRTVDSFAEFSPRDAATLRRWVEEFRPIVEHKGSDSVFQMRECGQEWLTRHGPLVFVVVGYGSLTYRRSAAAAPAKHDGAGDDEK
jgi:phytoene dehydrogenase-like protein